MLHPFFFATYPVLFLFAQNLREQITLHPLFTPLAVAVAAAGALFVALWVVFRRAHPAGQLATAAIGLFFSYGHAWNVVGGVLRDERILLVVWVALLMAAVAVAVRIRATAATMVLNLVGGALVIVNLVPIIGYQLDDAAHGDAHPGPPASQPSGAVAVGAAGGPDIYYLIFDRYGSERTLRAEFDFDNGPFLDELRSRGFYVAEHSTANYLKTAQSLASSLNLDYLDVPVLRERAPAPDHWRPVYSLLRNSFAVERVLHARGYQYVHLGSLWPPLHTNAAADANYTYAGLPEFSAELLETTAFRVFAQFFPVEESSTVPSDGIWTGPALRQSPEGRDAFYATQYRSTLYQLEWLHRVSELPSPKFVFAHVYLPHFPYVFDSDGSFVGRAEQQQRGVETGYIGQVEYTNSRILALVDTLLARPEYERPIILIQADEGPAPPRYDRNTRDFQWLEATDAELSMKFEILNAYFFPRVDPAETELYPTITPVNSFRVVFNAYFDAGYPLLPDRNWVFADERDVYDLHDVSDRVTEAFP